MKTTIDIADALLVQAKRRAQADHRTLRDLVEQGLRSVLEETPSTPTRFRIKPFTGRGMAPGMREGDWDIIRELLYPSTVPDDRH